jgi:hypothetical protein
LDWLVRVTKPAEGPRLEVRLNRIIGAAVTDSPRADQAELRLRLVEGALAAALADRSRMRAELEQLRASEQAAGTPHVSSDRSSDSDIRLAEALVENAALREELAQATSTRFVGGQSTRIRDEVAIVLEILLPRIKLVGDSLLYVATELSDRRMLYRVLRELASGDSGMPVGWKRIKGCAGWWERHLSTGRDDTGRIYSILDHDCQQWAALVSSKADQRRDIAWLQGLKIGR